MAELMLKFLNWDLKALRSNLAFETITLKAIFDPQNRQNRNFSAARREKTAKRREPKFEVTP